MQVKATIFNSSLPELLIHHYCEIMFFVPKKTFEFNGPIWTDIGDYPYFKQTTSHYTLFELDTPKIPHSWQPAGNA